MAACVPQENFMQQEAVFAVHWPRAQRTQAVEPVAPRLDDLSGKTIAFVWDYLFRGDEIFAIVQRELSARFPGLNFIGHEVFGSTHGADEREVLERLPAKLKELRVDAVVSGMGC
jgi:hypothetical protein